MLLACEGAVGGDRILSTAPTLHTYEDVLCVPPMPDLRQLGCYDCTGKLILESAIFRGVPAGTMVTSQIFTDLDIYDYQILPSEGQKFVYIGFIDAHYGHFLLSALSRLWFLSDVIGCMRPKFLYFTSSGSDIFDLDFMIELLAALNLRRDDFVKITDPVRVAAVTVAQPSFVENKCAMPVFQRLCRSVGERVVSTSRVGAASVARGDRAVYLSKSRLSGGVSRLVNEAEFEAELSRLGMDIVYPETLPFAEQIALFFQSSCVAATVGTALHTSIFAPPVSIVGLNYGAEVWSNQLLIDKLNGNRATYLHAGDHMSRQEASGFHNGFVLDDPAKAAEDFMRVVHAELITSARESGRTVIGLPGDRLAARPLGGGTLVSRGGRTMQSSVCAYSRATSPEEDSRGAVSGRLTGHYQFHTDDELAPWWQIDLGCVEHVSGVRLYNRLGHVAGRSAGVQILTSLDGASWSLVMARTQEGPFGGLDGKPLEWEPPVPVQARFVRITLPGRAILHLDQIEVFAHNPT